MNRKKIMYSILKEIEQGNAPNMKDYDLDIEAWGRIAEMIRDEGYARGVKVDRAGLEHKIVYVYYSSSDITEKGLIFLRETVSKLNNTSTATSYLVWLFFY